MVGHDNIPCEPAQTSPPPQSTFRNGTLGGSPLLTPADRSSLLSANYVPTKFGSGLVSRKRHEKELPEVHKQGGGREAFKADEARMPGANDEDYDGVQGTWFGHGPKKPALRWTKFKWIMFAANVIVRPSSIRFSVLALSARFAADSILPRCPHFLPAHMVPCLGYVGCHPKWKHGGAGHFNHRRLYGHRNLFDRLGGHPPQQPWFPGLVHLPVVDLFCLPRHSRVHHLQEAHFQPGRKT